MEEPRDVFIYQPFWCQSSWLPTKASVRTSSGWSQGFGASVVVNPSRCFLGETKVWKVSYWRKLLWLAFSSSSSPLLFLWWEDARFYFSSCFVFKTMDGEKENSLLAHSELSHKTVFGHELSTTDIVPRGGLCFPSISPAEGKRKKEF